MMGTYHNKGEFNMYKIMKVSLLTVSVLLFTSCGYDEKKHFPMPALDGLVIVIPFTDKVATGIKKTGQTKSYDLDSEVSHGSVKDDGYYQIGTAHDYGRDNVNAIVLDRVTKLMWQDNSDARTETMVWNNAVNYCNNLTLGAYHDWRLPTIVELKTLIKYDEPHPGKIDEIFQNTNSTPTGKYWSATVYREYSGFILFDHGWYIDFSGGVVWYKFKTIEQHVRCVNSTYL